MTQSAAGKPVVLLDLDRMLFNTDRFGRDLSGVLQARFKVLADEYLRTYPSYYVYSGELRYNDFFRHMRDLKLDPDTVEQAVLTDLSDNDYLYEDVPDFLHSTCVAGADVMVLTHGERRFQHLKFRLCRPLRHIMCQDVLTHKREFIARQFAGRHGLLLDDQPIGELTPGFRAVRVSRYGANDAYHSLYQVAGDWPTLMNEARRTAK